MTDCVLMYEVTIYGIDLSDKIFLMQEKLNLLFFALFLTFRFKDFISFIRNKKSHELKINQEVNTMEKNPQIHHETAQMQFA